MNTTGRMLGAVTLLALGLSAGCASRAQSGGGYYLDDGPGRPDPQRVAALMKQPDPVPKDEPLRARANRPYEVMGQKFVPMTERKPYRQQGVASWYGQRFHGKKTSIGETYDMYGMTAAHPTLPLPSYVRVTRLDNGRSVVVRVNDRGPFLRGRLIDLSYMAASKLGYVGNGHTNVEVELLDPAAGGTGMAATSSQPVALDGSMAGASSRPVAPDSSVVGASSRPVRPEGSMAGAGGSAAMSDSRTMASANEAVAPVTPPAGQASRTGMQNSRYGGVNNQSGRSLSDGTRSLQPVSLKQAEVALPVAATADAAPLSASTPAPAQEQPGAQNQRQAQPPDRPQLGPAPASVSAASPGGQPSDTPPDAPPAEASAAAEPPASEPSRELRASPQSARPAQGGHWFLQLGVFRQLDNALRAQREQQARTTPDDPPLELDQRGENYRVLLGPYRDEAQARAAAADIGARTGHKPGVIRR